MRYVVIIERAQGNLSAYVPDLPGCVATGSSREDVLTNIREAIEMHLQGMVEDHEPIPAPTSAAEYIEVDTATA